MPDFNELFADFNRYPVWLRLLTFAALAVGTHFSVRSLRWLLHRLALGQDGKRMRKLKSLASLLTSALVFTLYFFAVGLIFRELGISLTAYLASASVLALAIGFGSQGIVQDVVTGLTLVFSDLLDVGDLVEISGQTGIVKAVTMRFVELENAMGASVYIPNRTISNVINHPRGYVRCILDVTLRGDKEQKMLAEATALKVMQDVAEQFPGILMSNPSSEGRLSFSSGREVLRIKFRIWPNRGEPVETAFRQTLVAELKRNDPAYEPWMVAVSYEVEKKRLR